MRIGLIDVDGHHFPNLALMRISAWHKAHGNEVEWWRAEADHYDIVYMSKVFSDEYSKDAPLPMNADWFVKGGTGYAIHLSADGREYFDRAAHQDLAPDIEQCFPDYSIYPQYKFAVSMTSRGCPRGCVFCHVGPKEGRRTVKVADVSDFWCGQEEIKILDANLTACREKRELFRQYRETGAWLDFNQGLDIRLLDEDDVRDLNMMKVKHLHFAWDNPKHRLEDKFVWFTSVWKIKDHRRKLVYVLTNYDSTMDENLYRIYKLREFGYDPYVMVYDKPNAPAEIKRLQRWCNNRRIFAAVPNFRDYEG